MRALLECIAGALFAGGAAFAPGIPCLFTVNRRRQVPVVESTQQTCPVGQMHFTCIQSNRCPQVEASSLNASRTAMQASEGKGTLSRKAVSTRSNGFLFLLRNRTAWVLLGILEREHGVSNERDSPTTSVTRFVRLGAQLSTRAPAGRLSVRQDVN
jgi:hypothetical protein